jgi:hypothetical protein
MLMTMDDYSRSYIFDDDVYFLNDGGIYGRNHFCILQEVKIEVLSKLK